MKSVSGAQLMRKEELVTVQWVFEKERDFKNLLGLVERIHIL